MNSLDIISVAGAVLQIVSGEDGSSLDLITQAAPVVEITTTSLPGRNGTNGTNGTNGADGEAIIPPTLRGGAF